MQDDRKAKKRLIEEIHVLRQQITDLKTSAVSEQTHGTLKESEELFRLATENSSDGVIIIQGEQRLYFNNKYLELLGYTEKAELAARPAFSAVHPDDVDRVREIAALRQRGESTKLNYECRFIRKDRAIIHVEIASSLIFYKGKAASLGYIRDISERKRAEEALRESETKYRELIETTNTGYVIVDGDGGVLDANREYVRLTGHQDLKEILGRKVIEWTAGYQQEKNAKAVRKCITEGYIRNLEIDYVDTQGRITPIEINATVMAGKGATKVLTLCRDITDRKRAEDALLASQENFRLIGENARDTIWMMDMNLHYTYMSPYVEHIVGYTPEEFMSKPLNEVMTPASVDLCMKVYAEEMEAEKKEEKNLFRSRIIEVEHICKGGRIIWTEIKMTFIRDNTGCPSGILGFTRDINDRKMVEQAVLESEEKYRLVVENAWESIIITQDERVVFINRTGIDLIGYDEGAIRSRPFTDFIHPDDRNMVLDRHIRRTRGENIPSVYTFRITSPDGTLKWVEINAIVVSWKGRTAILNFLSDITKRRQAEESLNKSEERYRSMYENAVEGIFQSTPEGRFESVNPSLARMLGYNSPLEMIESITSIDHHFYVEADSRSEFKKRIHENSIIEGYESHVYRKDGRKIWISENTRVVYDSAGKVLYYEGTVEDITKEKLIAEELKQSEAIYRTVFDNSGTAMIMINEDTTIALCNREWVKLSGYSKEENENKKSWTEFVHEEDLKYMREYHHQRRIDSTDVPNQYEFRFIDRYGNIHNIINTVAIIPGTKMSVAAQLDVSELKHLESQLLQAQKLEAIGTLAGGIAHDFNNLLMAIQGYISLMLMNLEPAHPHYEKLRSIEERVMTGASLTKQLLGFARGGRYEVKPLDINNLLEKTSVMFGQTKKEIAISKNFQDGLWVVEADANQLEQVFFNLYVNAGQAMPGGGKLSLETVNATITKTDARAYEINPGRYVKISITDTGIGMDEKTKERIFEPFFTTKEMGRGTGLGLSMVYGIIKGHNGYINVYSEKAKGTSFSIYLPISKKEVINAESIKEPVIKGSGTILFVDDEAAIIKVMKEMLEALGYSVLIADNGPEALMVYDENKAIINLVILDLVMPNMGGGYIFDCLKQINPEVKVILSSGYSIDGEAQHILARGCRGFIQKPVNITILSQKIREVLAGC